MSSLFFIFFRIDQLCLQLLQSTDVSKRKAWNFNSIQPPFGFMKLSSFGLMGDIN
jgi:hypothetical protein